VASDIDTHETPGGAGPGARQSGLDAIRRTVDRVFDVTDPESPQSRSAVLIVWGVWTALLLILILSHEMWRDELQSWGLVRSSGTPFDVITNLRHEGHPPLWYLVLWPITKITRSPVGLQVVALVVGSSAAWITLRKMPVSLVMRSAIVFSYFPLFEMGTISRSYSLLWLLAVTASWLANRPQTPNWMIAVALTAVASTTVLAIPLTIAMAIGIWGGPWFASPRRGPLNIRWVGLFTVVPLAAAAIALPAVGGGPQADVARLSTTKIGASFAAVLHVAFPVTNAVDGFWGRFLVRGWTTWGPLLGMAIVVFMAWCLRRSRTALTIWIGSTLGFLVVLVATGVGMEPRRISPLWAGAIAAVWFAAADRRARPPVSRTSIPILTRVAIAAVLVASLWAAAWATKVDVSIPFSGSAAAADWIEAQAGGDDFVILCAINAAMCSSVSIRLDVPAYTSATSEPFTFVDWRPGWAKTPKAGEVPAMASTLAQRTGKKVFIVAPAAGYPLGCQNGGKPPKRFVTEFMVVCRADQLVTFPTK